MNEGLKAVEQVASSSSIEISSLETKLDRNITYMDFWSLTDPLLTVDKTAGDENLPNVVVASIPTGATIVRVVGMMKYAARFDTSGTDNRVVSLQAISIDTTDSRTSVVDMIDLPTDMMWTAADSKEGGDVIIGNNDVKAEVTGNGTYYVTWELADMYTDSISLYDVQVGLRVYFR